MFSCTGAGGAGFKLDGSSWEPGSEDSSCFAAPLMRKNETGGTLLPDVADFANASGLAAESMGPVLTLALDKRIRSNKSSSTSRCSSFCSLYAAVSSQPAGFTAGKGYTAVLRCDASAVSKEKVACTLAAVRELELGEPSAGEGNAPLSSLTHANSCAMTAKNLDECFHAHAAVDISCQLILFQRFENLCFQIHRI